MSDQNKNSVQRFSRRNRKDRLPKTGSLFPPEEVLPEALIPDVVAPEPEPVPVVEAASQPPAPPYAPPPELDLAALSLPDTDRDAVEALSKLSPDDVRAPLITPQAERYPPLQPVATRAENAALNADNIATQKAGRWRNARNNAITLLAWSATIAVGVWAGLVWINPQSVFNPLPPETPFVVITATSGAPDVNDANPLIPTANADGQVFIVATELATIAVQTTDSPYPFIVPDAVLHVPNGNDLGCEWWSIAGTVTGQNGAALDGYRVRVTGNGINETVFSGTIMTFGPGGFELPLIGTPQQAEFTVQLFSPQDAPLSQPVAVTTQASCDANVAIINFVQNR